MIHQSISVVQKFFGIIEQMNYFQLFLILALESTAFPIFIPIEAIVIPMGYLAFSGVRNLYCLFFSITSGIILGCLINYFTAKKLGRPFLYKYGKYFMIKTKTLEKWEARFLKNSNIIIFIGRFVPIPALKHIITLPAGLSNMNLSRFVFFSFLGALFFTTINLAIGYYFGADLKIINKFIIYIEYIIFFVLFCYLILFVIKNIRKKILKFKKSKIK